RSAVLVVGGRGACRRGLSEEKECREDGRAKKEALAPENGSRMSASLAMREKAKERGKRREGGVVEIVKRRLRRRRRAWMAGPCGAAAIHHYPRGAKSCRNARGAKCETAWPDGRT